MKLNLLQRGVPVLRPNTIWMRLVRTSDADGRRYMRLHPVARKLAAVAGIAAVSVAAAWMVKKNELIGGTSVSSTPARTIAETPLIRVKKAPAPKWADVTKMAEVAGEWTDPCGVSGPHTSVHGCGTVLHIRSGERAKEKDLPLSYYSWHLEFHPARGEVRFCGFRPQLQLSRDQDPEKSWRIGYCNSRKHTKQKAMRIGLVYQADNRNVLKVLIGDEVAILRRTK